MRLAVVLAKLCATESPTIFATGRKDSGDRLIGIPYRLAMIGQWARLFTQLTTFRTMTCFGESNGSAVLVTTRAFPSDPLMDVYDFFRFVRSGAVERGRWSTTVCSSPEWH